MARSGASFLAPLVAFVASCGSAPKGVHFSSDPPGARVLVDGEESGFVTPCVLKLAEKSKTLRVDLELRGYARATRWVADETQAEWVLWRDMLAGTNTWRFPLWLATADFMRPRQIVASKAPARIFVRLQRQADG